LTVPTYSYACTVCDNRFDVVQSFTDDALAACPQCNGKLRKLFNSVGIVFKGSGFYRTDSRNGSAAGDKPATPAAASSGDSDSGSAPKSDTAASTAKSDTAKPTPAPAA
jgi:putative FmdB family regulatory protein